MEMYSRDITSSILVYCDLISWTTPACFGTFYIDVLWSLLQLKIPNSFVYLFVKFCGKIIMTGEPMRISHQKKEMVL